MVFRTWIRQNSGRPTKTEVWRLRLQAYISIFYLVAPLVTIGKTPLSKPTFNLRNLANQFVNAEYLFSQTSILQPTKPEAVSKTNRLHQKNCDHKPRKRWFCTEFPMFSATERKLTAPCPVSHSVARESDNLGLDSCF